MSEFRDFTNFVELRKWLDSLPDQVLGSAGYICEAGEPYREFFASAPSRPEDCSFIERTVAREIGYQLQNYFNGRKGRIYWRVPFETHVFEWHQVIRFDEDGPDIDYLTDRKCYMDKNWRVVKCYARLYRATHPVTVFKNGKQVAAQAA